MSIQKKIVLKIGGSILYKDGLNINFELLKKLKDWYGDAKKDYSKIVILVGGGELSRQLQAYMGSKIRDERGRHEVAMSVTQTNAKIVKAYLQDDKNIATPTSIGDAYEILLNDKIKCVVSGGLKIGWSTDMDAAIFADIIDTDRVIKISDISYLYDKDPKKFDKVHIIKDITWKNYFKMFHIKNDDTHEANSHIPIDKICARFANNKGVQFFICGGDNIEKKKTLQHIITDGTLLHP
ncbi:hypothetical protein J6Z48_02185 [bacterium]|nr:hypothetical protein [bacterium]